MDREVPHSTRVIACDLDDVLCQTNLAVAQWHNARYGTQMTLDEFYYYHYWKNPHWGTPDETLAKVHEFYESKDFQELRPVDGAKEGLETLRDMGFSVQIVTARAGGHQVETEAWLEKHFPGLVNKVHYTGEFVRMQDDTVNVEKITKASVCRSISALLIIDDCANHTFTCASASPVVPSILFGDYQWNQRLSVTEDDKDFLSHDARTLIEGQPGWWEKDNLDSLPETMKRARSWPDAVQHISHMVGVQA
ncbi:hypothetical protein SISSUDRAFT_1076617 [Sistotremastrum suecicum HHB10207 ss-3]|uniref:HAD-like protein n=1 Tax=Sistotremastrum suecicum HHB10207 ss-3 TaxID=1314776 RepID=A0A166B5P8_9AGAM|nr:hypothetical protein SISSUDRAFT_1076617 [Sistotremastrum suecicum HHB10207 ss-3]